MRVSGKHNDLDNVGPSFRHHTFFEMLGNFSFGDYFKREAIPFAWSAADRRLEASEGQTARSRSSRAMRQSRATPRPTTSGGRSFPPNGSASWARTTTSGRWATRGRAAAARRSTTSAAPACRAARKLAGRTCRGLECSCDRYVEIWNNVFMEFDRQADGTLKPLPAPSIDTGMGLERVTAVLQGHLSNYDTDLFTPLLVGDRRTRRHDAPRHDGTVRRLDARGRRPHARDDVPHRRRRGAVQRMARLRAAQDHAARDAAREAARHARSRSCTRWSTRWSASSATRIRSSRPGATSWPR